MHMTDGRAVAAVHVQTLPPQLACCCFGQWIAAQSRALLTTFYREKQTLISWFFYFNYMNKIYNSNNNSNITTTQTANDGKSFN